MSVRLPSDTSPDVRVRVGLALAEAAIDRIVDVNRRAFEQSLIDNDAPPEHLEDLLCWQHESALAWREQTLADVRAWLVTHEREEELDRRV